MQLGDAQSDIISVTSMIQGSACGSQLFSLFMNFFVDDSNSIAEVASYQDVTLMQ